MRFNKNIAGSYLLFGLSMIVGSASGQPLCDVLLRPAFNFTTDGLTIQVEDSSRTFGLQANAIWDFGDGASASFDSSHSFLEPGTYEVCLTLTAVELPCSVTFCRSVTVPSSNCGGEIDASFAWSAMGTNAAFLSLTSLPTTTTTNLLWEFGDGTTSSEAAPTHAWYLPGEHFVSLTRWNDSCSASYGNWVLVDGNVTTCAPPGLFVDFQWYFDGTGYSFTPNVIANSVIPAFYIWSFGDGAIDTASVGQHQYYGDQSHQVCLLVGAVTTQLDSCFALVCSTIEPYTAAAVIENPGSNVVVHPNPFQDRLQFNLTNGHGDVVVRLVDMLGRTMLEQDLRNNGPVVLDTHALPEGSYILLLNGPSIQIRSKVIKVR